MVGKIMNLDDIEQNSMTLEAYLRLSTMLNSKCKFDGVARPRKNKSEENCSATAMLWQCPAIASGYNSILRQLTNGQMVVKEQTTVKSAEDFGISQQRLLPRLFK